MSSIPAKWTSIFAKRAAIYNWFSGIFAGELEDEQFYAYQHGEADDWFELFMAMGFEKETKRLKKAISRWQENGVKPIDLRADFAAFFLLDNKTAALPYASYYLEKDGQLYGDAETQMRYFLAQNRLEIETGFNEPADHLAVYLAILSRWTNESLKEKAPNETIREQADFLQQALLNWLPAFVEKCQSVAADSHFYAVLAQLLLAFVQADLAYLQQTIQVTGS